MPPWLCIGIYTGSWGIVLLTRARYWKLTPEEVVGLKYPEENLLNWDIKCTREPEVEAIFVGVFMYRNGTPNGYDSIPGIAYYYNHILPDEVSKITKFLKEKFGGEDMAKSERVLLQQSREIYSGADIGLLAGQLEEFLDAKAVITLEFTDFDEEAMTKAGLPPAKLLPIPTK